jgi:predicted RND superfamily exporter protein
VHQITPCFMTSLTTAVGLLSLLSADLVPLRQFGLVAAVGVGFAFLLTIGLLPLLLSMVPFPTERDRQRLRSGSMATVLNWLGRWSPGRALAVLGTVLLLTIPAALSLSSLTLGTSSLDYFRQHDTVRRQTEWIDSRIGGTTSLEFSVDTGTANGLTTPAFLRRMDRFQHYLETIDGITGIYSIVDIVKALHQGFNHGDPHTFAIPPTAQEVDDQLFLIEGGEELDAFLTKDRSQGRIMARIEMNASRQLAHRLPEITQKGRQIFGPTATVTPTGIVYLTYRMEGYLLASQIKSFLLAFLVISVAMVVLLRSVKLGVLAMIPNLLPILFTLALMPVFDIALDVGTVMIAGVTLGLIVDDTIHFLYRFKAEAQQRGDVRNAIAHTMHRTGRPIIYTSVILSLGLLVLGFASFRPVIYFGVLSSLVVVLAVLFDLVVLPAILGFVGMRAAR